MTRRHRQNRELASRLARRLAKALGNGETLEALAYAAALAVTVQAGRNADDDERATA